MTLHVRTGTITPALLHDVRTAVAGVDPPQSVGRVRPLVDAFRTAAFQRKWMAVVLDSGVFYSPSPAPSGW